MNSPHAWRVYSWAYLDTGHVQYEWISAEETTRGALCSSGERWFWITRTYRRVVSTRTHDTFSINKPNSKHTTSDALCSRWGEHQGSVDRLQHVFNCVGSGPTKAKVRRLQTTWNAELNIPLFLLEWFFIYYLGCLYVLQMSAFMPVCPSVFSTTVATMDFPLDVCIFLGGQEITVSSSSSCNIGLSKQARLERTLHW